MCLQLFCTNRALESHKEDTCENLIESVEVVETKPTFIDCNSEVENITEEKSHSEQELELELELEAEVEPEPKPKPSPASLLPILKPKPVQSNTFDMEPIQIHISMDSDGNPECRIRNSFPKDDTNREYYCYLCSRRYKQGINCFVKKIQTQI